MPLTQEQQLADRLEQRRREQEIEQQELEQERASWRRAIVHVLPSPDAPVAAVLLDLGDRTIRTFLGKRLADLPRTLGGYDWLVGLSIRQPVVTLGLDAERYRLAELSLAQKTLTLNRSGKKLSITHELLIAGNTGISRPLGDPSQIAQYLAEQKDSHWPGAWRAPRRRSTPSTRRHSA